MNEQLQEFARSTLKTGLTNLPEINQLIFKKMYSHNNLEISINDLVDQMPVDRLDWAIQQVSNTLTKGENYDRKK